ncbi:PREDICTED: uncharacterized protein LOC105564470 [Vollenhovia emeryi]|uniref:uncharacterized protein LOC105564470 n=1 Tax=Vollenhovia emeryi TaxID=411798 RepID=UPI0005F525A1|nr:PREDICTED: uncharacterized protein LOC105564470 [Vollenhovia emeryi]
MGKSAHKSRKRKRSSSGDRLTRLEEKLSRLISVLSRNEVRALGVPSPSASASSLPAHQSDQESNGDGDQEGQMGPHDSALTPTPPKTIILEETETIEEVPDETSADTLSKELFGSEPEGSNTLPWNELVIQKWRDLSQKGLPPEQRETLLKQYCPSEEAAFLKAPRLNPECRSALKK